MIELKKLFQWYGSDKAAGKHDYSVIYTELFEPIREKKLNILEMGVDQGASILSWLEYFPNSMIYGADILPFSPTPEQERYKYHSFDQAILDDYKEITCYTNADTNYTLQSHKRMYDIIIDDCSHITEYTIFSYLYLKNYLCPGGLYIIEDCNAKRAKHTKEILGKYGEIRNVGKDSMIIIRKDNRYVRQII